MMPRFSRLCTFPTQVVAIQEQGLTLLHLACLFGDARLAKACLTVVVSPLSPDIKSWSGLTALEVAAAQGYTKVMDILVRHGAHAPPSVLVAACVGNAYTGDLDLVLLVWSNSDRTRFFK
jgi:hypothetical protein